MRDGGLRDAAARSGAAERACASRGHEGAEEIVGYGHAAEFRRCLLKAHHLQFPSAAREFGPITLREACRSVPDHDLAVTMSHQRALDRRVPPRRIRVRVRGAAAFATKRRRKRGGPELVRRRDVRESRESHDAFDDAGLSGAYVNGTRTRGRHHAPV